MSLVQKQLFHSLFSIFLMTTAASTFASPINDAIRFWQFDGGFVDTKNGATSTQIGGVGFAEDRDGNLGAALSLDGYNDAVRIDPSLDMGALGSYSLSMWLKLDTSNDRSYLFDTRAPGGSGSGGFIFMDPRGGASTELSGYLGGTLLSTTAGLFDTNWHLVTLVRDILAPSAHLYLDGQAVDSSITSNSLINMNAGLVIGSYGQASPGSNYWTDGLIDDVAIWDRALDATEITQLFSSAASATSVPGPSTLLLLVLGLMGFSRLSSRKLS